MTKRPEIHHHVMGDHWTDDLSELTELGRLITLAKDRDNAEACEIIGRLIGEFVVGRHRLARHPSKSANATVVASVPPNPTILNHLPGRLAESVAEALGQRLDPELITRSNHTVRLRDTDPSERRNVAEHAGYNVTRPLDGASVVLVDDVIMTGTTVEYITELLLAAGAGSVDVVVASRTVRRPS